MDIEYSRLYVVMWDELFLPDQLLRRCMLTKNRLRGCCGGKEVIKRRIAMRQSAFNPVWLIACWKCGRTLYCWVAKVLVCLEVIVFTS
jgi:hypothetical protein